MKNQADNITGQELPGQEPGLVQSENINDTVQIQEKLTANAPAKSSAKDSDTVKSNRRILAGKVTSNKMNKTIVVSIERQVAHPIYKKYYKRTKKIMANDPNNDCNIGDVVRVKESRPLSARKRWELIEIVKRAK